MADVRPAGIPGWQLGLAALAMAAWFLGHVGSGISSIAIPVWVVAGLCLGFAAPRTGLIVTVIVVPYTGGATDPPQAELLRVIPVLGSGARIAVDRLRGERTRGAPSGFVVGLALLAGALFLLTAFTAYAGARNAERLVIAALPWLLGAPIACLAAWLAAAHDAGDLDTPLRSAVLASTAIACLVAIAAWFGVGWLVSFLYPVDVSGRLAAFGYAPPTGMAVAVALPLAAAAAKERHAILAVAVAALGLATILLTGSRGPLLALFLGVSVAVAVAVTGRRRIVLIAAALLAGFAAAIALVLIRYPGVPLDQLASSIVTPDTGDTVRVRSWWAALEIAAADPILGGGWRSLSRFDAMDLRGIGDSHNMLLAALANGGIPLAVAFGGVLLYSIRQMLVNRAVLAPAALASATTFLVAGMWDIPNLRSYGAVVGGLALGLVARRLTPDTAEDRRRRDGRVRRKARISPSGPA